MENALQMRVRQNLMLTPRLQQSVRLLQMSAMEFSQEMREALTTNPFLEEEGADDRGPAEVGALGGREQDAPVEAEPVADSSDADDGLPISIENQLPVERKAHDKDDDPEGDWTSWTEAIPSLRDHLKGQVMLSQLDDRSRAIVQIVIDTLDDDGYLRQDLAEIAALLQAEPPVEVEELNAALAMVRTLEPAGVGARNLSECLSLQINARAADTPGRALALCIARDHLQLVAGHEFGKLQRLEHCDEDAVRTALNLIRKLAPRPGSTFGDIDVRYIVPDVIVRKTRGRWTATINPAVYPRIRLNRVYADIFRRSRSESGGPMSQQLQEARWLIRNAEQRFTTIQRVAEAIIVRQKNFLDYGAVAMKPLALKQVAQELDLHESTISRVTNGKYMATPRGILEFKQFFSRKLATTSGGACSTSAIRALLRELIEAEDRLAPLSDARLAEVLAEQGVRVARRTVTKYRQSMKMSNVELRRLS